MTPIEQQIALEIFKPSLGFFSALLGPKIEKVKEWSKDNDLQGRIESEALSKIIHSYLEKLSRRVSEITSISFQHYKINISDAYEPLSLIPIRNHEKESAICVKSLLSRSNKSFIIIDRAGMGKSTFSKYLVTQILFKSDRIPLFFELRKINQDIGLIESIASELDSIGTPFPRDIFYQLVKKGKFTIILDGFDEVSIDFQTELSNQIYDLSVKGGDNILFLTSRPQEALPDLIDSISYQFSSFTIEQVKSLVLRYDKISNLDVGRRLIEQLNLVPPKFIETPLLVSLLYRTFGTNNSIADRVCTFYDEIYHALYKGHDLINKNGYVREKKSGLDFEDFRRLLRALCYYMAITRKTSFNSLGEFTIYIDKAINMSAVKPKSSQLFQDDLMVAVPLMIKDGGEYKFLHKTILEFFTAEYLIYKNNSLEVANKIFNGRLFPSFHKVFDFIHDISPTLFDNVVTKYHAVNLLNICNDENQRKQLLNTLIYNNDIQIGIWLFDEETTTNDDKLRDAIHHTYKDLISNGYSLFTRISIAIDMNTYLLTIASKENSSILHELAWKQISSPINLTIKSTNETKESVSDMLEMFKLNTFIKLDYNMVEKIINFDSIIDLALSVLKDHCASEYESIDYGIVFSPSKANALLNRLNTETSIDSEFDDLLS